jgi:hypothetical protein
MDDSFVKKKVNLAYTFDFDFVITGSRFLHLRHWLVGGWVDWGAYDELTENIIQYFPAN